jgi:PAS domain S-box-containing protein
MGASFVNEKIEEMGLDSDSARLLLKSVQGYAIYLLDPSGHVTTWNPAAQTIKGYSPHEVVGWSERRERVALEVPGEDNEPLAANLMADASPPYHPVGRNSACGRIKSGTERSTREDNQNAARALRSRLGAKQCHVRLCAPEGSVGHGERGTSCSLRET